MATRARAKVFIFTRVVSCFLFCVRVPYRSSDDHPVVERFFYFIHQVARGDLDEDFSGDDLTLETGRLLRMSE